MASIARRCSSSVRVRPTNRGISSSNGFCFFFVSLYFYTEHRCTEHCSAKLWSALNRKTIGDKKKQSEEDSCTVHRKALLRTKLILWKRQAAISFLFISEYQRFSHSPHTTELRTQKASNQSKKYTRTKIAWITRFKYFIIIINPVAFARYRLHESVQDQWRATLPARVNGAQSRIDTLSYVAIDFYMQKLLRDV